MITVLQFISSLSDGGAETLVKDYGILFKRHSELQIRCVLVTLHNVKDSANYKRLQNSGVEIVSIYNRHNKLISLHRQLFGSWYVPRRLSWIIEKYQPAAIHVHLGLLRYLLPISNRLKNIKLLYTCHNEPAVMFGHGNGEKEAAAFLIKNNNLQMIALHEEMRAQLNSMFGIDNTIVVNNGVDFTSFREIKENKDQIRMGLNIPKDAYVVGHIGRFTNQKNHLFLIEIFAKLYEKNRDSFLLLIGTGPTREKVVQKALELGVQERMLILSNRTDIPQLLKCMDVFVFPSLFEGLSVTLVEAQVSGLRCVISDTIKPNNVLVESTVQVPLESSIDEWCDAILDVNRRSMSHYDISGFDMNKVVEYLAKLYKNNKYGKNF